MTVRLRAEAVALARARRTGRSVVVSALTTPTVEVTAHPGGLLSLKSNVLPVRARVHGVWRALDPTLRSAAGGRWKPAVSATPLTFSGGGRGPLVNVTDPAGRAASMYWPAALPRPAVSGQVALYRNVLPGVDLRLEANGTGYTETLVVRDAAAAADPRLRSLIFTVKASRGLVLRPRADGTLDVLDARTGGQIFFVGRPQMWDSTSRGRVTQVPTGYRMAGAATATIAMAPPARALTGRQVHYPLFIDPTIQKATDFYVELLKDSNGDVDSWTPPDTAKGNGIVQVGYCGWDFTFCVKDQVLHFTSKVYFRFDTDVLEQTNGAKAHIYYVSFDDEQVFASDSCDNERLTDLYTSGDISPSTGWPGPEDDQVGIEKSNAGCDKDHPPANLEFDSDDIGDEKMLSALQSSADSSAPNITFELRADSEVDKAQFKYFMNNPTLSVYFNFPPQAPTGLMLQNQVTCDAPNVYTPSPQPVLLATGNDNNPSPLNLILNFAVETSAGVPAGGTIPPTKGGSSGSQQSAAPPTPLADGAYQFHATATNQPVDPVVDTVTVSPLTGPPSAWYPFTVLTAQPAKPTISSFDYPQNQWGQAAGAPGTFTLGSNGASNVAGFAYTFDGGAGSEPVPNTTDCNYLNDGGLGTSVDSTGDAGNSSGELAVGPDGTAQIEIPPNLKPDAPHTLFVKSFDMAHNASTEATYTFYLPQNFQTTQPVTVISGTSLVASATGPNASLVSAESCNNCGVNWFGTGNSQLHFSATAAGQSFTVPVTIPPNGAGWWQLGADLTLSNDFGQVQVDLDQSTSDINLGGTAELPPDGYRPATSLSYTDLGTQKLTAGTHTLTFTITGKNASSGAFGLGLNYLTLSPTNRYEAESLPHPAPAVGTLAPLYVAGPPWSDHGELAFTNTAVGSTFSIKFDAPVASPYAIGINLVTGPSEGTLQIDLDGVNVGGTQAHPLDAYSPAVGSTFVFLDGPLTFTAGTHVLQFTVRGTSGTGYDAGIDFVEAAPVTPADLTLTGGSAGMKITGGEQ
jgi:hypothetical protein